MKINLQRRKLLIGATITGISAFTFAIAQSPERTIKVVAKKFVFTPAKIQLKKGVPVVLEFTTLDVLMGFNAPDFGIRTDIFPKTPSSIRFTPNKTGEFTFFCDVFCGNGHEEMTGTILVS